MLNLSSVPHWKFLLFQKCYVNGMILGETSLALSLTPWISTHLRRLQFVTFQCWAIERDGCSACFLAARCLDWSTVWCVSVCVCFRKAGITNQGFVWIWTFASLVTGWFWDYSELKQALVRWEDSICKPRCVPTFPMSVVFTQAPAWVLNHMGLIAV